jgi:hypothetical protein
MNPDCRRPPNSSNDGRTTVAVFSGVLAGSLAWAYFGAVFIVGNVPWFGAVPWYGGIVAVAIALWLLLRRSIRNNALRAMTVLKLSAATLATTLSLFAADIAYAIYSWQPSGPTYNYDLQVDAQSLLAEIYPRLYYPTDRNFRLHKPQTLTRAEIFGAFYRPDMKTSKTLRESVLEAHPFEVAINAEGFRDDKPMASATVFALGDSFTFGWGVNLAESWVGRLNRESHEVVYNLGIHDSSPLQELKLLDFVLRTHGKPAGLKSVVWVIYEGNDLEGNYNDPRPAIPNAARSSKLEGTVLDLVRNVPNALKQEAILTRLRTGQITSELPSERAHRFVDGIGLGYLTLYRSETLGYELFMPEEIKLARAGADYVLNHPNRPKLEKTFEEMDRLAKEFGFRVSVVLMPTAERVHGSFFDGFPKLSERPHFLEFVRQLADHRQFRVLNLCDFFAPRASTELLYFRDDDHINRRGHQLVADLIRKHLFSDTAGGAQ